MSMDPSPSPGRAASRRSFPNLNLNHISLAPLSSRLPIDDDDYDEHIMTSSYIAGKSAPTTPSILSGSGAARKQRQKKPTSYAHESYFPPTSNMPSSLTKAKSTGIITSPQSYLGMSEDVTSPLQTRGPSKPLAKQDDDWFYRVGSAIAHGTRENKGQSWLVSRDSSTSLVQNADGEVIHRETEHLELQMARSQHASRSASRAASRVGSAKPSRRGSRAGSRIEFANAIDAKLTARSIEGYFDQAIEPDFVDKEETDARKDDAEVDRLSRVPGFGIGGLVDRLVGWPLFNVEEPSDEEDEAEEESAQSLRKKKLAQMKRRTEELERAAASSASATRPEPTVEKPREGSESKWNDAAWLLSVASKVIL